ncbi:Hypothetical_protein [Hexamita inflata]|uniref:Hypothetical_protein n=1 Tax=Hexamita inflata TaxID=28002 RepID=A0AA86QXK9_9EUKA|nr:Hypothetical protein HINF_LOCUS49029 [Hexamita inflata]
MKTQMKAPRQYNVHEMIIIYKLKQQELTKVNIQLVSGHTYFSTQNTISYLYQPLEFQPEYIVQIRKCNVVVHKAFGKQANIARNAQVQKLNRFQTALQSTLQKQAEETNSKGADVPTISRYFFEEKQVTMIIYRLVGFNFSINFNILVSTITMAWKHIFFQTIKQQLLSVF